MRIRSDESRIVGYVTLRLRCVEHRRDRGSEIILTGGRRMVGSGNGEGKGGGTVENETTAIKVAGSRGKLEQP